MADLSTTLGPLALKNPILVAAGTFGYGVEFKELVDLTRLGGVIAKTLTLKPRAGNPAPRIVETPSGMLNAIGLQNVGVEEFLNVQWPELRALPAPVILSVAGFSLAEFDELAGRLEGCGAAALELNLSCPNVSHGSGRCFAQSAADTAAVVSTVRRRWKGPLLAKLTAEVADLVSIAKAASEAGADILSLINTFSAMAIDVESGRPKLAHQTGGLSGPAIRPIAVRCIWEVRKAIMTPILGVGGIVSGADAAECLMAGASAVAVGTANFWDPRASNKIVNELDHFLNRKRRTVRQIIAQAAA